MKAEIWSVKFAPGEFAEAFPEIVKMDIPRSDQLRLALGLQPRGLKAGAPKDNKNAIGNAGRWQRKDESR